MYNMVYNCPAIMNVPTTLVWRWWHRPFTGWRINVVQARDQTRPCWYIQHMRLWNVCFRACVCYHALPIKCVVRCFVNIIVIIIPVRFRLYRIELVSSRTSPMRSLMIIFRHPFSPTIHTRHIQIYLLIVSIVMWTMTLCLRNHHAFNMSFCLYLSSIF